jgi:cholesterol oxidase
MSREDHDVDWLIVGSGFGDSVAALRLAEKGYRVLVLESGRRFEETDYAERTSQLRRYYWMPHLGLKGILRLTLFKDVFVATGAGVGGGSLGYANALYRANTAKDLAPYYDVAERMLGVVDYDQDSPAALLMRDYAVEHGFGDTYSRARVGVFLGTPGRQVPDPYFAGEGPERAGCLRCVSCMVGCRHNAKNTLVKNYLYFAERRGALISPERTVADIQPLSATNGVGGYAVTSVRSGTWFRRDRRTVTARGVIVAAGTLGTNRLLLRCKLAGSLPRISDRLGYLVRTNSESVLAVTAPDDSTDFTSTVALSSSIYPDSHTHIETVTYGHNGDSQSLLMTLATEAGRCGTRPLHFLLTAARQPRKFLRTLRIRRWSHRTVILTVMQTLDNSIRLRVKYRLPGGFPVLTTEQDPDNPNPNLIPAGYHAANWLAERLGGTVQAAVPEAVFAIPTTAHLLGGAVIGESAATGVVNHRHEIFGYPDLLVCDGAAVPANLGVNPSLTITAMIERAMSYISSKPGTFGSDPIRFGPPVE